jgi:anaerobic magnesium-protoporphyrin IX monomethyl ester cyclase
MKIFLLQSYLGRWEKPMFPLGLAYLAACLDGHEVQALDMNVVQDPYAELSANLKHFQPEVVGLSLRNIDTTQQRDPFVYLSTLAPTLAAIRKSVPHTRIIIGGSGFSIYAQVLMERFPDLDLGVFLEAEESFPALLQHLDHPETVPGIYYRSNGQVKLSSQPQIPDFSTLPSPRWDIVNLEPYQREYDLIGVQTTRGCGLKCAYCTYYFLNGPYYRLRDPEKIAAEIIDLNRRFKVQQFMFVDSVFNIPADHAEKICREFIRQKVNVPWTGWYNERILDEDFYKLAYEAGCRHFIFSPDAYNDRSLKLLKKNLRVKDIHKIYDLARRQTGARFAFNFFANPPGQTYMDFFRLLGFWLKVRFTLGEKLYYFGLNNIRIEPDTEIYRMAVEEGVLNPEINMLPLTSAELLPLFYTNPGTPLINAYLKLIDRLVRFKRAIRS